jgi:riboflavin kinase / FMN adenylyltransferase
MFKKTIIKGIVVHGRQDGRKIGFPTANITFDDNTLVFDLDMGIYASRIKVKNTWYDSATYYGKAVTYNFDKVILETHILDFDQDIYGEKVELEIIDFVRPVVKFDSLDELKIQISLDCTECKDILSKNLSKN